MDRRDGPLYWEVPAGRLAQAVRIGDLKAVRMDAGRPIEVYNLAADSGEKRNLAAEQTEFVARAEEIFRTGRTPSADFPAGGEAGAKAKPKRKP